MWESKIGRQIQNPSDAFSAAKKHEPHHGVFHQKLILVYCQDLGTPIMIRQQLSFHHHAEQPCLLSVACPAVPVPSLTLPFHSCLLAFANLPLLAEGILYLFLSTVSIILLHHLPPPLLSDTMSTSPDTMVVS
jgi:hypothetical protein